MKVESGRIALSIILLVLVYWMSFLYAPFLKNIAIASLLAIATYSFTDSLHRTSNNNVLVSLISTITLALLFFGTIFYAINYIVTTSNNIDLAPIKSFIEELQNYKNHLPSYLVKYTSKIDDFISHININDLSKYIFDITTFFASKSAIFFKDMLMIIIFYFFANLYGVKILAFFKKALPLSKGEFENITNEISSVMGVVFYSTLLTAMFEGALFSILGFIYGYDVIFLAIMYGFASLIPLIGGAIMFIPLAILEYSNGNTTGAIVIILYSLIVISIIADTFIKPMIIKFINQKMLKKPAFINELLIFFSIIAGLSTFGFWGMILGPAITTFFISIIKSFHK